MPDISTDHLTDGYDELTAARIKASFPGMAHFAGTGPIGQTCRTCKFWVKHGAEWTAPAVDDDDEPRTVRVTPPRRSDDGQLMPRRCAKFERLSGGEIVNRGVPHHARSCRFFEFEEKAPPIARQVRKGQSNEHACPPADGATAPDQHSMDAG